ncbi:MAG: aspartate-semialdehyde dehydrogenase [Bdellovibrionales bacterium]|nr:aspartate-semialdehyde dehydrogenase [Bdellovibrionales bacterium]
MRDQPIIAIAGATGVVGNEMLSVLEESKIPVGEVRLLASEDSRGEIYRFRGKEVYVEVLEENSFEGVDLALFATSAILSEKFVPIAVEHGAVAIDNSSHFRMQAGIPLVVPEVNAHLVTSKTRIIANPNCSTIQLVPILKIIHAAAGLRRVVVSTYQSVSGAGKAALDELWDQSLAIFNQKEIVNEAFQHQIAFNCIPQIDVLLENGYTKEEYKIINESRKILDLPNLKITATAVRVPVFVSHAESVNVETEREMTPQALIELLQTSKGIEVYPAATDYPMQIAVATSDTIHVGRIRQDESVLHGLDLWIVADNVRKGAALNAVQIAELILSPAH